MEVLNKSHFSLQTGKCPIPVAEHSGQSHFALRASSQCWSHFLLGVHWTFAEAKREEFVRYLLTIACEEQMQLSIVTIMTTAVPASSYSMSQTAKIRGVQGIITNIIHRGSPSSAISTNVISSNVV